MSNGPGTVLSIYVGEELKKKWLSYCAMNGTSSSKAMRSVVRKLTCRTSDSQVFLALIDQPDVRKKRVEVRLTVSEFECLQKRAEASGSSPNAWIVNMIRANLTQKAQFGHYELQVLGKSNSNLLAIGRNLNQIARWMNANKGGSPPDLLYVERLYAHVVSHTEEVTAVMRANLDRWVLK